MDPGKGESFLGGSSISGYRPNPENTLTLPATKPLNHPLGFTLDARCRSTAELSAAERPDFGPPQHHSWWLRAAARARYRGMDQGGSGAMLWYIQVGV